MQKIKINVKRKIVSKGMRCLYVVLVKIFKIEKYSQINVIYIVINFLPFSYIIFYICFSKIILLVHYLMLHNSVLRWHSPVPYGCVISGINTYTQLNPTRHHYSTLRSTSYTLYDKQKVDDFIFFCLSLPAKTKPVTDLTSSLYTG